MRVVGYVRESADPTIDRPAFTQQEELRRHAHERGLMLVSICQDLRVPGRPVERDGYLSLLGVVASGGVDAVLVPGLDTFSADTIVQEIVMWDLRARGVRVLSTVDADLDVIDRSTPPDASRMLIRDVLNRVEEHTASVLPRDFDAVTIHPDGDVYVRFIETEATEISPR
jgi:DNA invertase Pin-like site-specific DNA recombinase